MDTPNPKLYREIPKGDKKSRYENISEDSYTLRIVPVSVWKGITYFVA